MCIRWVILGVRAVRWRCLCFSKNAIPCVCVCVCVCMCVCVCVCVCVYVCVCVCCVWGGRGWSGVRGPMGMGRVGGRRGGGGWMSQGALRRLGPSSIYLMLL